ncbi:MAG: rod-binding protein [Moraxellaceae bacterium]|nr:rod-binding protein [Pseudobdellovibrionaceae bacterium]
MTDVSKLGKLNPTFNLEKKGEVSKEKLREVADMYEKHFLKEMMKQMKSTVSEGSGMFKKNNAEKIFQEQLDDEHAGQWNKQGSFGLSNLIYDQLMDRYGSQFGLKENLEKPSGPIELDQKKHDIKNLNSTDEFSLKIESKEPAGASIENQAVKNPWAGTLQSKELINDDHTLYKIKHDNGLESLITIQGGASEKSRFLSSGDYLQAGDEIGLARKTSPLFWTVRSNLNEG